MRFKSNEYTMLAEHEKKAYLAIEHYEAAEDIHSVLKNKIQSVFFPDYLMRYIYEKNTSTDKPSFESTKPNIAWYDSILKNAFEDTQTPMSFTPTKAKDATLRKGWLTQKTVGRNVVLLLGFALEMNVDEVNDFLTKGIGDYAINIKSSHEAICYYCYKNGMNFNTYQRLKSTYDTISKEELKKYKSNKFTYSEETRVLRKSAFSISNEAQLFSYLAALSDDKNLVRYNRTARKYFEKLFVKALESIEKIKKYSLIDNLDYEQKTKSKNENDDAPEVPKSAIEKYLYRGLGETTHNKENKITGVVYRPTSIHSDGDFIKDLLTRQHLNSLLEKDVTVTKTNGKSRITKVKLKETAKIERSDIISLNFLVHASVYLDKLPDSYDEAEEYMKLCKKRYEDFCTDTQKILNDCSLGNFYAQNLYEFCLMLCMASDDPVAVLNDVLMEVVCAEEETQSF